MLYVQDTIYWLALRRIPGMGPVALRRLWHKSGEVKLAWEDACQELPKSSEYLDEASKELDAAARQSIQIITLSDSSYPNSLRNIPDISPILYIKGQLKPQDERSASIVGTRHPSPYGAEVTQRLTGQLVSQQYTIISGMAKGVDAIAHRTAIEAGGRTIAVWGSGLDCVYPPDHKALAELIVENGAIISQFPLGTLAQSYTFPARNKIIAGLSQFIIITEARAKSGSLLTAQAGLKYGRQIGAVPGSIHNIGSVGPHHLIKNGAKLVVDAADIVDTMTTATTVQHQNHPPVTPITASEKAMLNQLQSGPQHVDELIRHSSQSAAEVVSVLAMLEIKGVIKQLAPGEYLKT